MLPGKEIFGLLQVEPKCPLLHTDPNIEPPGRETAQRKALSCWTPDSTAQGTAAPILLVVETNILKTQAKNKLITSISHGFLKANLRSPAFLWLCLFDFTIYYEIFDSTVWKDSSSSELSTYSSSSLND